MKFSGKVALVTGSSSGIGEAIAEAFAGAGASVVVNSSSSVEAGIAVAARLPRAAYVQADVSREDDARRLVDETVERFGRLDVLVNNAGTTEVIAHGDVDAATAEVWRRILAVNVIGTWLVTQAAVPHLRASGSGSIVNITSLAGVRQVGSSIPYAVSKAGLNHLTRLLARALGPEIRVNAIAPGLVTTPWTQDWDAIREFQNENAPLRRTGEPSDIAGLCVMLAAQTYVTGEVLVADGGLGLL